MKDFKQILTIIWLILISIPTLIWVAYEWLRLMEGMEFRLESGLSFFTCLILAYWIWYVKHKIIEQE